MRAAYRWQRGQWDVTPRLPLQIAEPDVLIEHALRLAGTEGLPAVRLREIVPVAQPRYDRALWRLESAHMIARSKERRPDCGGRMREQVIWRLVEELQP